jgi:tetratricopeptide (TPR) repeat protein
MHYWVRVLIASPLVLGAAASWSVPSGPMEMPSTVSAPRSKEDTARLAYNSGLELLEKGDRLEAAAQKEPNPKRQQRTVADAKKAFTRASRKFEEATVNAPEMAEAWNGLGYTKRKTGDFDVALAAYEQALKLRPKYPEALEYRGEAYLGLNRVADAQQAYLDLFAVNRAMSEQLLSSMKAWIDARRKTPGDVDPTKVDELEKWIQERSQIAAQTASLTREHAATGWR